MSALSAAKRAYSQKLRDQINRLPKKDRRWWSLNRQLLHNKVKLTSIPALRDEHGNWVTRASQKAELFKDTWMSKYALPPMDSEDLFFTDPGPIHANVIRFNSRVCERIFKRLKDQCATGPDNIPVRILKFIAPFISIPFSRIVKKMTEEAYWPDHWRFHRLLPFYKKKAYFDPGNYRGLHITSILSKVAERLIAHSLSPFFQQVAFGANQWAYRRGCGSKDLLFYMFCS